MKYFKFKDLSGRGFTAKNIPLTSILEMENELDQYGEENLHDWAKEAQPDDEFRTRTELFVCTKDILPRNKKQPLGKTSQNITAANFFEAVTADTISKAPQAIKEAYELAHSLKNDGIDPFNTGEAEIDETMQLMLEKLNSFLLPTSDSIVLHNNKTQTNEPKIKTAPKKAVKDNSAAKAHKTTRAPKKANKNAVRAVATTSANATNSNAPARKSVKASKVKKTTKAQKVKTVVKTIKVKEPKAPVTVKKLSKELQIIKSFVAMNGKRYKTKFVEFKYTQLFNFLPEAVDHKTVIEDIWKRLGNAVKAIKDNNLEEITLNIEPAFITKCTNLVKNAKVRVRTEFLSGASKSKAVDKLYKEAEKLLQSHVNMDGKLEYSEKEYGYLSDDLDHVDIGYYKKKPDGTYQEELSEDGYKLTEKEAVKMLTHRIKSIKSEISGLGCACEDKKPLNGATGMWSKKVVDAVDRISELRNQDKQAQAQKEFAKLTANEQKAFWEQFEVVYAYDAGDVPMDEAITEWKQWLSSKKAKRK